MKTSKMFKKKKDSAMKKDSVTDIAAENEIESNVKKTKKKRQSDKCNSLRECWGFCHFLKTSWKLFKEFSGDTSIHGKFLTFKIT